MDRFFNKIIELRNKKLAHADLHDTNIPFKFRGLNSEEIKEGFHQLHVIKEVFDNCTAVFESDYSIQIPYNDNRTENFIRYQAEYEDYYNKNFMK